MQRYYAPLMFRMGLGKPFFGVACFVKSSRKREKSRRAITGLLDNFVVEETRFLDGHMDMPSTQVDEGGTLVPLVHVLSLVALHSGMQR